MLRLAAPLVVSFWMRAGVTLVDTIYASLLGDAAVAAVGLTIPLEFLMIAGWVGLSTGLTSGLSRAMGAGYHARVEQYLGVGWRLLWILAPLFTAVGAAVWFVAPRLALEAQTASAFRVYGSVLIAGSALTTFWSILPDSLVKAHQDTRSTMWAGIWTNGLNVALNSLFLFVFHWGVFGIALSTVLGRIGGLMYALRRARLHENRRRAEAEGADPGPLDPGAYRSVLGLAVPSSMTFALMSAEAAVVNGLLATMRDSTQAIAAYAIHYRLVLFGLQPMIATSVAMLPYAARRVGAADFDGVRRGFREANLAAAVYSLVLLGPILVLAAPWIAAHLTESPLTARYAEFGVRLAPLACLASAPFLLCRPIFEALGRGRPGLAMAIVRYVVLTGPLAWGGMHLAARAGRPELYGLLVGALIAAALASLGFYFWLRRDIPRAAPAGDAAGV